MRTRDSNTLDLLKGFRATKGVCSAPCCWSMERCVVDNFRMCEDCGSVYESQEGDKQSRCLFCRRSPNP